MHFLKSIAVVVLSILTSTTSVAGQTGADTIVVFDGSGSMWGQIEERAKIDIARDMLSSVLSELDAAQNIGMIAYGHRQKGDCSDIEDVVGLGPAGETVPAMIRSANSIVPRGKTPITDAVRRAAEALKYTENPATVVLLTDGIETCDADPCALATELKRLGVGFTAHVVGFGLTEEEGREVQCLADTTGGLYFSAQNADELGDALRQTVQAQTVVPDEGEVDDDLPAPRRVIFRFRDTPEGKQIGARELTGSIERADGAPVGEDGFRFAFPEANGFSATADLEPGTYTGRFLRAAGILGGYDVTYVFEVPEGDGEHVIEASFAGTLRINLFINPKMPFNEGDPFPRATGGSGPRINFHIYAVNEGVISAEPIARGRTGKQDFPLAAGKYLVRGVLDRTTAAEATIDVTGGTITELDFSFDATRVYVNARDATGAPVKRQTTFWYDEVPAGRNYWVRGGGVRNGEVQPFYLPTGDWVVNVGGEGKGKRRSTLLVSVPGDYADIRIEAGESLVLSDVDIEYLQSPAFSGCVEIMKIEHDGCLVRSDARSVVEDFQTTTQQAAPQSTPDPADVEVQTEEMPPKDEAANVPSDGAGSAQLDALSGAALVFVSPSSEGRFYIAYDPASPTNATFALDPGWCGEDSCTGTRLVFPYKEIAPFFSDEDRTWTMFSDEGYLFQVRKTGDESLVFISGDGGRDIPFTLEEVIVLTEDTGALQSSPTLQQVPPVGVFSLHEDAPLETILATIDPLIKCQSEPIVFYPDGTLEQKAFNSLDATDIYSTEYSASCDVQNGVQSCQTAKVNQAIDAFLSFTATPLENGHLRLCDQRGGLCQIATACFYTGSDLIAATPLPNGAKLIDVLLSRQDQQKPGFGYDASNALRLD